MVTELVDKIESSFTRIREHPKFIIRNRVYKGGGEYGGGLVEVYNKFQKVKGRLGEIDPEIIKYNQETLQKIFGNIIETLELFNEFDMKGMEVDSAKKFITVASIEVDSLQEKLNEISMIDVSSIPTDDMKLQANLDLLRSKIEDNLSQIMKSYEWKSFIARNGTTLDGREKIDSWKDLIPSCIVLSSHLTNPENLALVSILSMHFRDSAARNLESIDMNLPLLRSIIRLLIRFEKGEIEDKQLTEDAFRKDVEHMINTKRLAWLGSIHRYYVISDDPSILLTFAKEFYIMSRDPKDQFQKTLTIVARSQKNDELDDITVKYANLASTVLSLRNRIEELGLVEILNLIEELESMTIFDTLDINDLYHPEKIDISHLINTVATQVEKLKDLALEIIQIEELKEDLFTMIQFTDFEANLSDPSELTAYFRRF